MRNKLANRAHEDAGAHTTRTFSKHGLSKAARELKRMHNKRGRLREARILAKDSF